MSGVLPLDETLAFMLSSMFLAEIPIGISFIIGAFESEDIDIEQSDIVWRGLLDLRRA